MGKYKGLPEFHELKAEMATSILNSMLNGRDPESLKNSSFRERMAFLAVKMAESLLIELKIAGGSTTGHAQSSETILSNKTVSRNIPSPVASLTPPNQKGTSPSPAPLESIPSRPPFRTLDDIQQENKLTFTSVEQDDLVNDASTTRPNKLQEFDYKKKK